MRDVGAEGQDPFIIRRVQAADEDYVASGVWKIAYADFMTAMMAFFLVMWLINATSDTTKTGIANYFNPIKLSDATNLPRKGLRDPEGAEPRTDGDEVGKASERAAGGGQAEAMQRAKAPSDRDWPGSDRGILLRDPYAILAAIAADSAAKAEMNPAAPAAARPEIPGEESAYLRDPFEPRLAAAGQSGKGEHAAGVEAPPQPDGKAGERQLSPQGTEEGAALAVEGIGPGLSGGAHRARQGADQKIERQATPEIEADETVATLSAGARVEDLPEVTIREGDDGVLISLSDHADFGMFAIGSAEPLPETVEIMEKIAGLLGDMPGRVIISGHTDGRPFRSKQHGNWQLSAARAQMAYQMLVQGGLDGTRVIRIEGHADRELKVPDDPSAAENRRIEILVERLPS